MALPIPIEMEPMLAASKSALPTGPGWEYEPKWDGFRVVVHREGSQVELISRGAKPMTRYFPELLEPIRSLPGPDLVLDGEVVVVGADGLDFDALLQRVHPAESRVRLLSQSTPASYVTFDILAQGKQDLRQLPLQRRRATLEALVTDAVPSIHLTPYTLDSELAQDWFDRFEGAGLDGVIAKPWDSGYQPGRRGWVKVKHERTADCVVIGFRWDSKRVSVGSLLLGLFDDGGELNYVGHTSSFSAAQRRELLELLLPMRQPSLIDHGRAPGGTSRWSRGRETDWESIRPELVCEVSYDKLQSGQRFRHATTFRRWRADKPPKECRFDQIFSSAKIDVGSIFST
jgi:ATP-dependent DNA ligase